MLVLVKYFKGFFQENVLKTGDIQVDEMLLEGHLGVTKELLSLQSAEKKHHIGSENGGSNLIKVTTFIVV